jgi:hypothetical protein
MIPIASPVIGDEEIERVTRVLESGTLADGTIVREFEREFADYCEREHDAVLVREGELEDRPLQFSVYVEADDLPREPLDDRNRVYDTGSVSLYT